MDAGHFKSSLFSKTNEWVDPLSNHTSTISLNFSKSSDLYFSPKNLCGLSENQQSDPSFSYIFAIFSLTSSSTNISLVFLLTKIGRGTPQTLCLETHQSGLVSIIDLNLSFPLLG